MKPLYDKIGIGYAELRQPDARIARKIHDALGDARSVLNVGARTGSYEPKDRKVTAIEPSLEMIKQRSPESEVIVHQAAAEDLPFEDCFFDAAMAVLTVHHWSDLRRGLREMRRVAKHRVVILTFDPSAPYFWLVDYIPELVELDQPIMPNLGVFDEVFKKTNVEIVEVPHDCTDGFLGAYWRRPHSYLDPLVRSAISSFPKLGDLSIPLKRLEDDLSSGAWKDRYGHLMTQESLDIGYRLIVAEL